MYKVIIAPRAKKQLKNISKSISRDAIGLTIEDLKEDPHIGKRLARELAGRYSYRIGIYRVIYKIHEREKVVEIISAGHRSKVYQ